MARHGVVVLLLVSSALMVPVPARAQGIASEGLAHPRRIRSFIGAYHELLVPVETQLVRMGLGDALLILGGGTVGGTEYRLELAAGVASEFDMAASSFDFVAADFLVGLPLSVQRGPVDARLRVYHQSSHLGDDVLARDDVVLDSRDAYDFEAIELFLGVRTWRLRPYAGFEYRFRRTPDEQDPSVVHLGADFRSRGRTRILGGVHGWWAENGGDEVGVQARLGLEVSRSGRGRQGGWPLRVFLEGGWGRPDAGRFFRSRRETFGLTVEVAR